MAGLVAPILPIGIKLTGILFDILGKGFVQDPLSKMQTMLTVNETLLLNRTDLINNWNESSSWNIQNYYDRLDTPHETPQGIVQSVWLHQCLRQTWSFCSAKSDWKIIERWNRKSIVATIYILSVSICIWFHGLGNILSYFNTSELVYTRFEWNSIEKIIRVLHRRRYRRRRYQTSRNQVRRDAFDELGNLTEDLILFR